MKTVFVIETHIYEEERLKDEVLDNALLDDIQSCGILGPDIVLPLRKNRYCELEFEYTERTTLLDVRKAVLRRLESIESPVRIAFWGKEDRYWIANLGAYFANLVKKYLDIENSGRIRVGAYVSTDAGVVYRNGDLRYEVHSREAGKHNLPHIHVRTTSFEHEAAICVLDGRVLSGELPGKLLKTAQKKILSDREYFLNCWNTMTDGLRVDINKHYGKIAY